MAIHGNRLGIASGAFSQVRHQPSSQGPETVLTSSHSGKTMECITMPGTTPRGIPTGTLGGFCTSPPATTAWGANRFDVFVRGTGNEIYYRSWNSTSWQSSWNSLGGSFQSPPAVVSRSPNHLSALGIRPNDAMYHKALMMVFSLLWLP